MVLDKFGSGLKGTLKRIAGLSIVDKEAVETIMQELQRTLIQADVDIGMVSELSKGIREKVLKAKLPKGMSLKEYFIKTFYDEMVNFLGKEPGTIPLKRQRILLIGLFGSGKTTLCGKLAKWFKTRGLKPGLVACDTHRAAAQTQLKQLGKKLEVPVYSEGKKPGDFAPQRKRSGTSPAPTPLDIAKNALKKSREDILIFDSAGRDALDKELAKELKDLGKTIKPQEVFLVIPADLGQAARSQSEEFSKLVGITGIIVTKLDGTAKGGGALAATRVSGAVVKFLGTGEKPDDFEVYDPKRFVSRLIGYGDIQGLLEKARSAGVEVSEEKAKDLLRGEFSLEDFQEQIRQMQKMGPLKKVMDMIPGASGLKLPKGFLDVQEDKMKRWNHIIKSMTRDERRDPEKVMNASRVKRVARGSGARESEVRELLKYYRQAKKVMKLAKGGKGLKRGPLAQLAKQFGAG